MRVQTTCLILVLALIADFGSTSDLMMEPCNEVKDIDASSSTSGYISASVKISNSTDTKLTNHCKAWRILRLNNSELLFKFVWIHLGTLTKGNHCTDGYVAIFDGDKIDGSKLITKLCRPSEALHRQISTSPTSTASFVLFRPNPISLIGRSTFMLKWTKTDVGIAHIRNVHLMAELELNRNKNAFNLEINDEANEDDDVGVGGWFSGDESASSFGDPFTLAHNYGDEYPDNCLTFLSCWLHAIVGLISAVVGVLLVVGGNFIILYRLAVSRRRAKRRSNKLLEFQAYAMKSKRRFTYAPIAPSIDDRRRKSVMWMSMPPPSPQPPTQPDITHHHHDHGRRNSMIV